RHFLEKVSPSIPPYPLPSHFKDVHPYRIPHPGFTFYERYGFESFFLLRKGVDNNAKARLHTKAGLSSSVQSETGIQ
ncbi:MAG: hypothetical protein ACLVIW_16310, partial [Bilophila wadsworthia]